MKISIITVCYNAGNHIRQAIQSVITQNYQNIEYIIIDGDSKDNTKDIVLSYSDSIAKFVSKSDRGIYHAMNKGIKLASGDYLYFLGSDDYLFDRDVIGDVVNFIRRNLNYYFIYGNIEVRSTHNSPFIHKPPKPQNALDELICSCLPHQASFAHRSLFDRRNIGLFSEKYRTASDYEWFVKVASSAAKNNLKLGYYDRVIASYNSEGVSCNMKNMENVLTEMFEVQNEMEVYQSKYWLNRRIEKYQKLLVNPNGHWGLNRDQTNYYQEDSMDKALDYHRIVTLPNKESVPKELSVHFFTIVLNGQPFIKYHIDIFNQLPFRWHWHIVEGVANLKHDTAWSKELGGKIIEEIHHQGLSKDGTTEYLDSLVEAYPHNISVYRKPQGVFWDGKLEMVNAPLSNILEECLLWQVDVDELWTVEQISTARQMFMEQPEKTAAFYWCWYFVGENLVISTRNCYSQNPTQEWLRTWRFKPNDLWKTHEPPRLVETLENGQTRDIASVNPFLHHDTESKGLVFQHYAYVTPEQLRFKEIYYGYQNAGSRWLGLQLQNKFPLFLSDYFEWVTDNTMVDLPETCGVVPIVTRDLSTNEWRFRSPEELQTAQQDIQAIFPKIAVDGVFFQFYSTTGIARVWRSLLRQWTESGFSKHIVLIDRAGTSPKVTGIKYCSIQPYDYNKTGEDSRVLQQLCDQEKIDVFISTYYTAPLSTPSIFMAYDMIPEVLQANLDDPGWREKKYGILYASTYLAISNNTARDLIRFFPNIDPELVTVAYCGLDEQFEVANTEQIEEFKNKHGVVKPYFLLVGDRVGLNGYKNGRYFFQAFSQLSNKQEFSIVCVGGNSRLELDMSTLVPNIETHVIFLSDEELKTAYSGAIALIYPSLYEGFGLPILEAMACGCPIISCRNSSIPEVAGQAAIYVSQSDVNELISALSQVQVPEIRASLITAGLEQSKKFSWSKMAETIANVLLKTAEQYKDIAPMPSLWEDFRRIQAELQDLKLQPQGFKSPEVQNSQLQLQSQSQLESNLALIKAMQTSKFWKLREGWLNIKQFLGLPVELFESQVNHYAPIGIQSQQAQTTIEAMKSSKFWQLRESWFQLKKKLGLPSDE